LEETREKRRRRRRTIIRLGIVRILMIWIILRKEMLT
jgi:predicted nucleic acid-binding Zn ribbon protein